MYTCTIQQVLQTSSSPSSGGGDTGGLHSLARIPSCLDGTWRAAFGGFWGGFGGFQGGFWVILGGFWGCGGFRGQKGFGEFRGA